MLQGCLYVAPIWREPVDLAPEIVLPEPDTGSELRLVFQADVETLTVVAQDPEEEPLTFVWEVPHGADYTHTEFEQEGGITVSTVEILRDPVLDGARISCTILDTALNSASVSWLVEVP